MKLVLASQSPRRKELMGFFNRPFTVRVADIDETMDPGEDPRREVARVSRRKAEAVQRQPGVIIGFYSNDCMKTFSSRPYNRLDWKMITM